MDHKTVNLCAVNSSIINIEDFNTDHYNPRIYAKFSFVFLMEDGDNSTIRVILNLGESNYHTISNVCIWVLVIFFKTKKLWPNFLLVWLSFRVWKEHSQTPKSYHISCNFRELFVDKNQKIFWKNFPLNWQVTQFQEMRYPLHLQTFFGSGHDNIGALRTHSWILYRERKF